MKLYELELGLIQYKNSINFRRENFDNRQVAIIKAVGAARTAVGAARTLSYRPGARARHLEKRHPGRPASHWQVNPGYPGIENVDWDNPG